MTTNSQKRHIIMSVSNFGGSTENLFDFKLSQVGVETDNALIIEEITKEL